MAEYLSQAVPRGESKYSIIRWGWSGLDKSDVIDSGKITDCDGIFALPPYLVSSPKAYDFGLDYSEPIGIFSAANRVMIVYRSGSGIKMDYFPGSDLSARYTGTLGAAKGTEEDFAYRSVVQFNSATNTENIAEAEFIRKLLVFPDKKSLDLYQSADFTPAILGDSFPDLKYAAVYSSRLFGADDNLVYASSYNDYADWDLDTADEVSSANAWVSMSQSNVKADGKFTAVYLSLIHI